LNQLLTQNSPFEIDKNPNVEFSGLNIELEAAQNSQLNTHSSQILNFEF